MGAGLNKMFSRRKNGIETIKEPLPNTMDIVQDSLGVLVYQENTMRIAQRVAGFDDNQADSYLRKAQSKKKRDLMALCDQWFIYGKINQQPPIGYDANNKKQVYYDPDCKYGAEIKGGINNGYDEKQLTDYVIMIQDFCNYLFNKSHAVAYSFLSMCCLYLKHYHKTEFFAALLSLQDTQKKIQLYCNTAKKYKISILPPNINLSKENFKALADKKILYGLSSVKGVGEASIQHIINNAPYKDLEDAYQKLGSKYFNKTIGEALIKAGAFDYLIKNRNTLLNQFQLIRKAKKEEAFDENEYNKQVCMKYEVSTLGASLTNKTYWESLKSNSKSNIELKIESIDEIYDKNGGLMAFITVEIDYEIISAVMFASAYSSFKDSFKYVYEEDTKIYTPVFAEIKKDENNKMIINKLINKLPEVNKKNKKESINRMLDLIG